MKKILIAAPLALAAVLATPASAASWNNAGQLRAEINQLDRQIDNVRGLSSREDQRLENQVDRLQNLYRSYARGGFTRNELRTLDSQVTAVKAQVFAQSRDRNGRFDGHDRYDNHDRHDGHDGYNRR
jgi:hypothetical protein